VVVAASSKDEKAEAEEGDPAFNPFGFVTDNPSSRTAIQLPESPAQDGNVGQMLYVMPASPSSCLILLAVRFLLMAS
jgi:hypothetical protein